MSCCGGNCGCGPGCNCATSCGGNGCKMYPDMGHSGEMGADKIIIVDGGASKKNIEEGSEKGAGEGKQGGEAGNACSCNPCNCNPCNCK